MTGIPSLHNVQVQSLQSSVICDAAEHGAVVLESDGVLLNFTRMVKNKNKTRASKSTFAKMSSNFSTFKVNYLLNVLSGPLIFCPKLLFWPPHAKNSSTHIFFFLLFFS